MARHQCSFSRTNKWGEVFTVIGCDSFDDAIKIIERAVHDRNLTHPETVSDKQMQHTSSVRSSTENIYQRDKPIATIDAISTQNLNQIEKPVTTQKFPGVDEIEKFDRQGNSLGFVKRPGA